MPTATLSGRGSLCALNGSLCVRRGHWSAHESLCRGVCFGPQRALECPRVTVSRCVFRMGHCACAHGTSPLSDRGSLCHGMLGLRLGTGLK